jgi:hypothetical protein
VLDNQPNPATVPAWPPNPAPPTPPSGFSTLPPPPDNQTSCVPAGYYPPPGGCPILSVPASVVAGTQLTASFTLYGSNNAPAGCTLTSTDGTFTNALAQANPASYPFSGSTSGTVPGGVAAGNYTYTLTCPYPDTAGQQSVTVSAVVNVLAPPTLSASPNPVAVNSPVTLTFALNGSSTCALTGSDGFSFTADGQTSATDTPTVAATVTYTLACKTPTATSTTTQVTVTAGTAMLSVNPASVGGGSPATVGWTLNGNSNCSVSYGQAYGSWQTAPPNPLTPATGSVTYISNSNDGANLSGVPGCAYASGVIFTLSCANNVVVQACLGVSE